MSETLPPVARPLAILFKINNSMATRGLDGLTDDEAWRRLDGHGNPIAWILGHLTETRAQMLGLLSAPWDPGFGGVFKRGSALHERSAYPSRAEIVAQWDASHGRMREAFDALTEERLAADSPVSLGGAKTVADLLAFFAFHESYHMGQIGYIRKQLGHTALAG